jgi:phosphoglycerol transferase
LESSIVSKENEGFVEKSYIPYLEKEGLKNINFSHTDSLGGAASVRGTTWTAASLIAQTSGIPLKLELSEVEDENDVPLQNIYTIGEILNDYGYNNYFMLGSDANFGLRRQYFANHGNYEIYDYTWAKENKYIPKDYYEWWGYEDKKLYTFAKEKILDAYNEGQPFNFTILTADTHFTDGYVDSSCSNKFNIQYANSYNCADTMLNDFLKWIRQQSFYDNTVIVITGDHVSMQEFIDFDEYERTVYNIFINSKVDTDNTKNRIFSIMDLYPTTLAALGFTIEGERLGIGTNLFSEKETILEEKGVTVVNNQISYNDEYYNKLIDLDYINNKKKEKENIELENKEKEKLEK